ncbi:MAG: NAD(P)/FAD-dependent oxidoreductase [Acidimicrobiia bacterium]
MRVVIVGAGLAGLMAGGALAGDHDVMLLDKGRSPGGRLATRRIGGAVLDHGAQFFTVRADEFADHVHRWRRDGIVAEWCRGFEHPADGFPRHLVNGGMNALAKHLARGLDVRCGALVFAVRPDSPAGWSVGLDDGTAVAADALIVTCPLPQAYSLLVTAGVSLPRPLAEQDYDRTMALLAVLDGPSAVPVPGGLQHPDDVFSFVGDNRVKGISPVDAVTFHANARWSEAHWGDDHDEAHRLLREAAVPWLDGASIVESQVKRWRFATPRAPWPDRCWVATAADGAAAPLVLAGDAFGGAKIEGAALSGLAAAHAIASG